LQTTMADEEEEEPLPPYVYGFADGREGLGPREKGVTQAISVTVPVEGEEDAEATTREKTGEVTLLGARSTIEAGEPGKATFPNGDTYTGGYFAGLRHGQGTYVYSGGRPAEEGDDPPPPKGTYEGTWKKSIKERVGIMTYAGGAKYHGAWKAGKREGQGTMFYASGDIYSGEWTGGKKHGQGTYLYKASGAELVGTWVEGVITKGIFRDKFGGKYEGVFEGGASQVGYVTGGIFTTPAGAVTAVA